MKTVVEGAVFRKQAERIWKDHEREAFIDWIALHWMDGSVIRVGQGARKIRWSRQGSGKSGGVRVIYFYLDEDDALLLAAVYTKSDRSTMKGHEARGMKQ